MDKFYDTNTYTHNSEQFKTKRQQNSRIFGQTQLLKITSLDINSINEAEAAGKIY